jgi:hypothetical protein
MAELQPKKSVERSQWQSPGLLPLALRKAAVAREMSAATAEGEGREAAEAALAEARARRARGRAMPEVKWEKVSVDVKRQQIYTYVA